MEKITVSLPLYGVAPDEKYISEIIGKNGDNFMEVTSLLCAQMDIRAVYCEDSLSVEGISVDEKGGVADVVFDAYAYYGCQDMDGSFQFQEAWEFEFIGDDIVFDINKPLIQEDREDDI